MAPTLPPLVRPYLGYPQQEALLYALQGAEAPAAAALLDQLVVTLQAMPHYLHTRALGGAALVHLHYFQGESHWYVTELDGEVKQASGYGFVVINGDLQNADPQYIDIAYLVRYATELDLYWTPLTVGALKAALITRKGDT
jgi:hypothetical protein